MSTNIGLSKSKLLSFHQCPRRLWLEHHRPELAEASAVTDGVFETGRVVGEVARQLYGQGRGHFVSFDDGVKGAIERTRELLSVESTAPIFEAPFDYDGIVVRADILDRSHDAPRIVEVKASTSVKDQHILDCAIQAWTLGQLGVSLRQVAVAHVNSQFLYQGDGCYDGLLSEEDVTEAIGEHCKTLPDLVAQARSTLASTDEPSTLVGPHCGSPYECPFYQHCAPPEGEYPVFALGGRQERLFALLHAGHRDVRDVPEDRLRTERERRIWRQTKRGTPFAEALTKTRPPLLARNGPRAEPSCASPDALIVIDR